MDFANRVVLITGGASGIGLATATLLRTVSAHVIIADQDVPRGADAAASIGADFVELDVRDLERWRTVSDRLRADHGHLDAVFLNAGVNCAERGIADVTPEMLARTAETNLYGVVYGIQACLDLLRVHGGTIVVTASIAGLRGSEADPIYGMTKHGIIGLVRSLARQLAEQGVRINAVCPTVTDTPMVRANARFSAEAAALGLELLQPTDVAHAVLALLASDATGEAIVCRVGHFPAAWSFPAPDETGRPRIPDPGRVPGEFLHAAPRI